MKMFKMFIAGIIAATFISCGTQKENIKETKKYYDHKSCIEPYIINNAANSVNYDICYISYVEHNNKYDYYTIYAFSYLYNRTICIADDISTKQYTNNFLPGTKFIRVWKNIPDDTYLIINIENVE